jgi:imidazole glycerol-phosphate synthase subunit HisH
MSGTVAIVDYGSGNLRSAAKAFARAASEAGLPLEIVVTDSPETIRRAARVVLPGVGAFGDCRAGLDSRPGLMAALEDVVRRDKRPFMGICVGMQLFADEGREHGVHPGFGWIPGWVERLADAPERKIPHMGWNDLILTGRGETHPVFRNLPNGGQVYFVHSFAMTAAEPADVLATTEYSGTITAAVGRDNIVGTQFHPEKSQAVGLAVIRNFLTWTPSP